MIENLDPYPKYKKSGVPWLGDVPEHWEALPNRAAFAEIKESNHPDEPLLSVTIGRGVITQSELLRNSSKKDSSNRDKSKYKLVCPGDIAYNKMRAWQGAVGASAYRGIVSPAYIVIRPRTKQDPRYLHYLLRTPAFAKEAERWSYGISSDQWSLRPEEFRQMYCCFPSLAEQSAIVRFLDHADRKIRRYIKAKQKLIALLEEQKQAIIHRAVTRGLDPNVRLKPSGIDWLGDVPEHWEVIRFSRAIADGPRNGISPSIDERGTIETFSISAIRDGKVDVREDDIKYISGDRAALEASYGLRCEDILLVRGNGNIRFVGRAGLVHHDMPGRVYPDLLMRVRVRSGCSARYLVAYLNSRSGRDQIEMAAKTAVGTFKINNQHARQLWICLPPISEQCAIVDALTADTGGINNAISMAEREISLLREYRTRLVSDVVTGKLDVREAAAKLPDEVDEGETEDENVDMESDAEDTAVSEDDE